MIVPVPVLLRLVTACWTALLLAAPPVSPAAPPTLAPPRALVAGGTLPPAAPRGVIAAEPGTAARTAPYVAPLAGPLDLRRAFDPPAVRWGAGHRGVDLGASVGQEVLSPGAGTVTFAGDVAGRGVVTVRHPDGLRSSLEPLVPAVAPGDAVDAGEVVGSLSEVPGHCTPSSCLHWGVRDGDAYVNPLRLLLAGPTVLLPGP